MNMTFIRKVSCPYCGHTNTVRIDRNSFEQREIVICDIEDGGCDKEFAVLIKTEITFNVKISEIKWGMKGKKND